ncbi:hypothetical protein D3C76_1696950 [compost metagenome]
MYAALPLLFCGSELAREGGLTADPFFSNVPSLTVGASLLAKAACQSTEILQMYSVPVGASLLAMTA